MIHILVGLADIPHAVEIGVHVRLTATQDVRGSVDLRRTIDGLSVVTVTGEDRVVPDVVPVGAVFVEYLDARLPLGREPQGDDPASGQSRVHGEPEVRHPEHRIGVHHVQKAVGGRSQRVLSEDVRGPGHPALGSQKRLRAPSPVAHDGHFVLGRSDGGQRQERECKEHSQHDDKRCASFRPKPGVSHRMHVRSLSVGDIGNSVEFLALVLGVRSTGRSGIGFAGALLDVISLIGRYAESGRGTWSALKWLFPLSQGYVRECFGVANAICFATRLSWTLKSEIAARAIYFATRFSRRLRT